MLVRAVCLRCLDRYAVRYGERYQRALDSGAPSEPLRAIRAFFDVTLHRIADPAVPDGCLVAQTAMAIPVLSPPSPRALSKPWGCSARGSKPPCGARS